MPASSPLCSLTTLYLNFFLSDHLTYILLNMSAQSWLSVPPAPACISIYASNESASLDKKHLISFFFSIILKFLILANTSSLISLLFSSSANLYSSFISSSWLSDSLKELIKSSKSFFLLLFLWSFYLAKNWHHYLLWLSSLGKYRFSRYSLMINIFYLFFKI